MALVESKLNLMLLSSAVFSILEQFRETLNEADRYNQDHGDHMLALWGSIGSALQGNPDASSEEALALAAEALAHSEPNGSVLVYQSVITGLARRYAQGSLGDKDVIELSRRLLHEPTGLSSEQGNLGGLFASLLQGAGRIQRLRQLAEQLGAGALFEGGLAMLAGDASGIPALQAGVALIVQNSVLVNPAHRARSAELVLNSLLLEVDRQTWSSANSAG
jgi:hypothetical protein